MKTRDKGTKFGGIDRNLDPLARQEQSRAQAQRTRALLQSTQLPAAPVHLTRPGVSTPTAMRYATTADPTSWLSPDAGRPLIEAAFDAVKDAGDRAIMAWPSKPGGAFVASCIFLREARSSGRLAHATVGYWPWREGATRAARSVLVNPERHRAGVTSCVQRSEKSRVAEHRFGHDSLCMLEMRLKDLIKSGGSDTRKHQEHRRAQSDSVGNNLGVCAEPVTRERRHFRRHPNRCCAAYRKYTSMGEPHAGLIEHVEAIGDPDRSLSRLLGLPAATNPDGLTRFLTCPRTKQHGLDLVVVDLTRVGRSDIQDDWEKRLEVFSPRWTASRAGVLRFWS